MENKERIEELNGQLQTELNSWDLLNVDPNQVIQFNPTKTDFWLQSITKYLVDKGIIDEDEFVIFFKESMLSELKRVRKQVVEPEVARARIHIPDGPGRFN